MNRSPTTSNIRIIPRDNDFLDRKLGSRGEVFFDQQANTLRLFDGVTSGGIPLLRADLENIEGVIGAALGDTPPAGSVAGTIWFNTSNGRLYIYYNDGTSSQWIQPTTPSYGSGSGGGVSALLDLSDVVISSPTAGQVLKFNGTAWVNGTDEVGGGSSSGATNLNELTDVVISTPTLNQVVQFNGVSWINSTLPASVTSITAGAGITVSASSGAVTITNTSAVSPFSSLSDSANASLTVDKFYLPAITKLTVSNISASAFRFDQYGTTNNPTIYAISGTTIAFELDNAGHPFTIQDPAGTAYSTGLVHVTEDGTVSTGGAAQGKTSGTLYWKIPFSINGGYRYQCSDHSVMVGSIFIKNISAL